MKKTCFVIILMYAVIISIAIGQSNDTTRTAEKVAFLCKAPVRVQEYYRVFDSLARTPQDTPACQKWTISELKKYASLVSEANEYDPIMLDNDYKEKNNKAHTLKGKYITTNIDVVMYVGQYISKMHEALILSPYWLTVIVEEIKALPYKPSNYDDKKMTEYRIRVKIEHVWKGGKYRIGDEEQCYYLDTWSYAGLVKGRKYIMALFPVIRDDYNNEVIPGLGGPGSVQESVFPIENGYVIDESNMFKLGKKVEVGEFENELSFAIEQIKDWWESTH